MLVLATLGASPRSVSGSDPGSFKLLSLHWVSEYVRFCMSLKSPGSRVSKESACSAGDLGLIPGLGRFPGEEIPLWYSCLENPMDRGAWWMTVYWVTRVGHNLATKPPLEQGL